MRIGLYLGVKTSAGGMFQYTQSVREALHASGHETVELHADKWTDLISKSLLAALIPAPLCRVIMRTCPTYHRFRKCKLDAIIYPAQEVLTFQMPLPAIGTIHDLMHRYEPHFPEVSRFAHREYRFRNIARYALKILVDSEVGKHHVIESYKVDAAKIFPLPYIPPNIAGDANLLPALPEKFIVYPAQFWAHKNHVRLLEAASGIAGIHLVFTGGFAHEYERVRARAEALGVNVLFTGYLPQAAMPELFARARGMVFPTFFGPTNIPPLEALRAGCPVAVSRIYAMPEQLGDAALYFDPKNVDEMRNALHTLWEDDTTCAILKAKGLKHAQRFTQEGFTSRLAHILVTK